jgi:hypothetical protein
MYIVVVVYSPKILGTGPKFLQTLRIMRALNETSAQCQKKIENLRIIVEAIFKPMKS